MGACYTLGFLSRVERFASTISDRISAVFMPIAAVVENKFRVLPVRAFASWCREGPAPGPSSRPDVKNVSLRRCVVIAGAPILDKS